MQNGAETKTGQGTMAMKMPNGAEKSSSEAVGAERAFTDPTSNVGVTMAYTKNLGNFENVKMSVSLHMPCYPTEIDDLFPFVKGWVDDRMSDMIEEVESDLGK